MKSKYHERIELLPYDIYVTHSKEMDVVEKVQKYLNNKGIGWHYYLDLAWMIRELSSLPKGSIIIDAGAGNGLGQFILSELGFNVICADVVNRNFTPVMRRRYGDLIYDLDEFKKSISQKNLWSFIRDKSLNFNRTEQIDYGQILSSDIEEKCGRIFIYNTDLEDMVDIPDDSVDSVMSISALEHNDLEKMPRCINEQLRVIKTTGALVATISASYGDDWYDENSKGWCLSENSIRNIFQLGKNVPSNFSEMNPIAEILKIQNNLLDINLSPFYATSGNTAMPWGKWDPRYLPVGVIKKKAASSGDTQETWKPVSSMSTEDQLEYTRDVLKGIIEKSGYHLRELKNGNDRRLEMIEKSLSWRITKPLRGMRKAISRLSRILRITE